MAPVGPVGPAVPSELMAKIMLEKLNPTSLPPWLVALTSSTSPADNANSPVMEGVLYTPDELAPENTTNADTSPFTYTPIS